MYDVAMYESSGGKSDVYSFRCGDDYPPWSTCIDGEVGVLWWGLFEDMCWW